MLEDEVVRDSASALRRQEEKWQPRKQQQQRNTTLENICTYQTEVDWL